MSSSRTTSLRGAATALIAGFALAACSAAPEDTATQPPSPSETGPSQRVAAWTHDIGAEVWAHPLVDGASVIWGADDGVLRSLDATTGTVEWEFTAGGKLRGGAATDGERYFVVGDDAVLYAVSSAGDLEWTLDVGEPAVRGDYENYGSRPAVSDGVVFAGSPDGAVYAVDAASGAQIWRAGIGTSIQTDIAVADGLVHASTMSGHHVALDAATGKEAWSLETRAPVTTNPVVIGDKVVIGSRSALIQVRDAATGEKVWTESYGGSWVQSGAVDLGDGTFAIGSSDYKAIRSFGTDDGETAWLTIMGGWTWAPLVVADGVIYAPEVRTTSHEPWDVALTALDASSGDVLWTANTGDSLAWAPDGFATHGVVASAAVAGDFVIVAGLDGVVYAFDR